MTNGARPAASDCIATRRQGQCVMCASRKTRRRAPRISGRSGSAKRTAIARLASTARPRDDIEESLASNPAASPISALTLDPLHEKLASRAVLAAFAFTAIFFTGQFPPFANPNELSRLEAVYAAGELGTLSIDGAIPVLGDHEDKSVSSGRFYSNKAPGPGVRGLSRSTGCCAPSSRAARRRRTPIFVWLRLLTVSLALRRSRWRGSSARARDVRRRAPLVGFAVAFGTPFLFYARSFFATPGTAALLFLAWDLLPAARGARRDAARRGAARRRRVARRLGRHLRVHGRAARCCVLAFATRSARRLAAFRRGRRRAARAARSPTTRSCFGSPLVLSSAREAYGQYSALAREGPLRVRLAEPDRRGRYLVIRRAACCSSRRFWRLVVAGLRALVPSGRRPAGGPRLPRRRSSGFFVLPLRLPELARRLGARQPVPAPRALLRRARAAARARDAALARALRDRRDLRGDGARAADGVLAALPARHAVAAGHRIALVPRARLGRAEPPLGLRALLSLLLPAAAVGRRGGLCLRAAAPLAPPSAVGLARRCCSSSSARGATEPSLLRAALAGGDLRGVLGQRPDARSSRASSHEAATPEDSAGAAGAGAVRAARRGRTPRRRRG